MQGHVFIQLLGTNHKLELPIIKDGSLATFPQKIESVDFIKSVSDFRKLIGEQLNVDTRELELVYCGKYLKDSENLRSYRLASGCTVYIRKKIHPRQNDTDPLDDVAVRQVTRALRRILSAPASRTTLERLLANPDTLQNLVTSNPALAYDPVAMAIFQDEEMLMLATLVHKDVMQRMFTSHPSLGHAALTLVTSVNEESVRLVGTGAIPASSSSTNPRILYGLDQMSDEEEEDDAHGNVPLQPRISSSRPYQYAISPAASGASPAASGGSGGGGQITSDFFRQAMQLVYSRDDQTAQPALPSTSSHSAQPLVHGSQQRAAVSEVQLQQLRDMGITDEALARRALEASGGDIQTALEFLFGDGMT